VSAIVRENETPSASKYGGVEKKLLSLLPISPVGRSEAIVEPSNIPVIAVMEPEDSVIAMLPESSPEIVKSTVSAWAAGAPITAKRKGIIHRDFRIC
jgi:hypothetical protein